VKQVFPRFCWKFFRTIFFKVEVFAGLPGNNCRERKVLPPSRRGRKIPAGYYFPLAPKIDA
jgi:hypothetical protein